MALWHVSNPSQMLDPVTELLRGARQLWRARLICREWGATGNRTGCSGHDRYPADERKHTFGSGHADRRDAQPREYFIAGHSNYAGTHAPANRRRVFE